MKDTEAIKHERCSSEFSGTYDSLKGNMRFLFKSRQESITNKLII